MIETCKRRSNGWISLVLFLTAAVGMVRAQSVDDASAKVINPLASKQEMIRDRFQRFQDRIFNLREQLAESEPENAARLAKALQHAGELGLADKLEEIILLLNDPSSLHKAVDEEQAFLANAEQLLQLLLAQSGDEEERRKELQRLEEYKQQVEQMLEAQRELREKSGDAAAAQQMKAQLDQAIQRVAELQKRQDALSNAAQQKAASGKPAEDKAASQAQGDLSKDTEKFSEDLEQIAKPPTDDDKSPALQKAREAAAKAAQSSQSGAKSMEQAGESLKSGDQPSASQQQKEASEALEKAREELEAARKTLDEQSDGSESAEPQEKLADQAEELSEKMKQDTKSGGQQGQQDGKQGGKSGSPTPGQQNVDQAQQQMEKAAESLGQKSPGGATPKQDKAIEQLEQAKGDLEKAIEELRKEERAETLRDLESRLRNMLALQKPINDDTLKLYSVGEENFKRAEQLQLAELSTKQRELSGQATSCLHILDEDASTIAFPHVMEQLVEDMNVSADRLAAFQTGAITQTIQAEIIDTLEQLLEAVQKMQEENQNPSGGPSSQSDAPQPLLPPSAELKLLRSSQLRINNRTNIIAEAVAKGGEATESAGATLRKLAERQLECADIARDMREKQLQQP